MSAYGAKRVGYGSSEIVADLKSGRRAIFNPHQINAVVEMEEGVLHVYMADDPTPTEVLATLKEFGLAMGVDIDRREPVRRPKRWPIAPVAKVEVPNPETDVHGPGSDVAETT